MSTETRIPAGEELKAAAAEAGLPISSVERGEAAGGRPTIVQHVAESPLQIELSEEFAPVTEEQTSGLRSYLHQMAVRSKAAEPELYVTLSGLPLRFTGFQWPFHRSTSGADTYIVHGTVHLADGTESPLHAKISASMTVTFAEVVAAPEQPFAEDFIYNAVRKTFDYSQLELLKSGNRQPVPVTMRYYSRWQKKFMFADTDDAQRREFLERKAFWLSAVHRNAKVWLADPRDAQYLNTGVDELKQQAQALAAEGFVSGLDVDGFAVATDTLRQREGQMRAALDAALAMIKPAFNEDMRAGHTNM